MAGISNSIDFIVKNGLQVTANLVVGSYANNSLINQIANGAIISGNVGIGTASVSAGNTAAIYGGNLFIAGNLRLGDTATTIGGILFSDGTFQNTASTGGGGGTSITLSNDTSTNAPRYIGFASATSGTLTTLYTSNPGLIYYPSTGNLTVGGNIVAGSTRFGNVSITNTDVSTNQYTGALIVAGGVGVAQNVFVGNSLWAGNATITNITVSTSTSTGVVVLRGGAGISGNVYVGGNIYATNATTTTNSTLGAIVATGGIATGNNLYVSGSTWTGNLAIMNTTPASSQSTGALTVAGGAGISGNVYANTYFGIANTAFNASNITVTTTSTANATFYPAFIESTSGNLGVRTDSALTYNPSTDALTAGQFIPTSASAPTAGIFLPSAGTPAISTSGTERLRINVLGNVGIGTADPRNLLHVAGNILISNSATIGGIIFSDGTFQSTATTSSSPSTLTLGLVVAVSLGTALQ